MRTGVISHTQARTAMMKFVICLRLLYFTIFLQFCICKDDIVGVPERKKPRGTGPIFIIQPESKATVVINGRSIVLNCLVHGDPDPTVSWHTKDGVQILDQSSLLGASLKILSNNSLEFQASGSSSSTFNADHASVFHCRARNKYGIIVSRPVDITTVAVAQEYTTQVYDEYVIASNTALFNCHLPSYISDHVEVTSWIKDDHFRITKNSEGAKYFITHNGDLLITNVSAEDSGTTYKCETRYKLNGTPRISRKGGKLHVTSPSSSIPPRIIKSMPEIEIQAGTKILIPCIAHGYPTPVIRWCFKKLNEENECDEIRNNSDMVTIGGSLVMEATKDKTGIYKCKAVNDMGQQEASTRLRVISKISVFVHPQNQISEIGKYASMKCFVSGGPITFAYWLKDGKRLSNQLNDGNSKAVTSFNISEVNASSKGMYQCFVGNDFQVEQATAQLTLSAIPPEMTQTFESKVSNPMESIQISCTAIGDPLPKIRWKLRNENIEKSIRINFIESSLEGAVRSTLMISSMVVSDGGIYTCQAKNKIGEDSFSQRIEVNGPPIVWSVTNKTAVAGDNVVLDCFLSGYPIDRIIWMKDDSQLNHGGRILIMKNGSLGIERVSPSNDEGKYTCIAQNERKPASKAHGYLKVLEPPQMIPMLPRRVYKLGKMFYLSCAVASGNPPLEFSWQFNGKTLPVNLQLTVSDSTYSSTLSSPKLKFHHSGNYSCKAQNSAGASYQNTIVLISGPPTWKLKPSSKSVQLNQRIYLPCSGNGFPKTSSSWWMKSKGDQTRINNNTRIGISVLQNGSLLIQSMPKNLFDVLFICKISNSINPDLSAEITLKLQKKKIIFTHKNNNEEFRTDDTSLLICQAVGTGPFTVQWLNGSKAIETSRARKYDRIIPGGVESKLEIRKSKVSDSGLYKCRIVTQYSRNSSIFYLSVKDKDVSGRTEFGNSNMDIDKIRQKTEKSSIMATNSSSAQTNDFGILQLSSVTLLYIIPTTTAAVVLLIILVIVCVLLGGQRRRNKRSKAGSYHGDSKRDSTGTLRSKTYGGVESMATLPKYGDRYYQMQLESRKSMDGNSDASSQMSTYPRNSSQIQPYATFTAGNRPENSASIELKNFE